MSDDNKEGAGVPVRECGNGECGWKGTTERMLGSIGPLCPECGETTELAVMPAAPSDAADAARWRFAMDWDTKDFAVCYRDENAWVPIKTNGPIDAALSQTMQPQAGAVVLCPNGEPWDENPDGIVPGQEQGPRMNRDTGFWEGAEADEEDAMADEAIAAGHTPGDSVPGVSTAALVRATARLAAPGAAIAAREQEATKAVDVLDEFEAEHNGFYLEPAQYTEWFNKLRAALASRKEAPATPQAAIPAAPSEALTAAELRGKLLAAANYIDVLGGDSKNFRASLAALTQPTTVQQASSEEIVANWVAEQWHAEVANRPLVNVHRKRLDDKWRQLLERLHVDHRARLGPTHDELTAQTTALPGGNGEGE